MSQVVTVQNMSFNVGQTMTITGVPTPNSNAFSVNIGFNEDELALHVNPRFDAVGDKRTVVVNSYLGNKWGQETRTKDFPFNRGDEFQITITFTTVEFTIILPDGFIIHHPNYPCAAKYEYFMFKGEVTIQGIQVK